MLMLLIFTPGLWGPDESRGDKLESFTADESLILVANQCMWKRVFSIPVMALTRQVQRVIDR
jgi:hypothetical protein